MQFLLGQAIIRLELLLKPLPQILKTRAQKILLALLHGGQALKVLLQTDGHRFLVMAVKLLMLNLTITLSAPFVGLPCDVGLG